MVQRCHGLTTASNSIIVLYISHFYAMILDHYGVLKFLSLLCSDKHPCPVNQFLDQILFKYHLQTILESLATDSVIQSVITICLTWEIRVLWSNVIYLHSFFDQFSSCKRRKTNLPLKNAPVKSTLWNARYMFKKIVFVRGIFYWLGISLSFFTIRHFCNHVSLLMFIDT